MHSGSDSADIIMRKSQYTLQFCTPAFLGNAEQSGQWRTPPFKAQLRQWWRVAFAASRQFRINAEELRQEEGRLFGNAWLENSFSKSKVRIRLEHWSDGKLKAWEGLDNTVIHREVPKPVGAQLYMGFGPLVFRSGTALKANAAIQSGETNTFSLAYPQDDASLLEDALVLMDRFGTVGGRSRNGWGSYSLRPLSDSTSATAVIPVRPWCEALSLDWPHAIGTDAKGPLVWQTRPASDWKALMKTLATIKIGLRTHFGFNSGKNAPRPEDRHWLSYPVTNHSVQSWGNNARLPNSLRFKVRPTANGELVGVIFHMPCLPPASFTPDQQIITAVWQKAHVFLDAPDRQLTRIPA